MLKKQSLKKDNKNMFKFKAIILLAFIPALVLPVHFCGAETPISGYLPKPGELGGWNPSDEPQHMKGEDLFLLINGGAEIYHEYGFKEVIAQGFRNADKKSFNLEIYHMSSPEAAYGIYSFKTGDSGKPLDTGDEGLLEEYYLNFRKGSFLVTITGFDSEQETLDGLVKAARLIASKIKESGKPPHLLQGLPDDFKGSLKPHSVTYLKGPLGLFNQYEFDPRDIFSVKEGVAADYGGFRLFIFKYENSGDAAKTFKFASSALAKNPRFLDFSAKENHFTMVAKDEHDVYGKVYGRYIFILVRSFLNSWRSEWIAEKIVLGLDKIAKKPV
jgi:hypothetical protein